MLDDLAFRNFRSLCSVQMKLKPLNFVIGPNASGKSNILKALRFLHQAVAGDIREWRAYDSQIDDLLWFGFDERGERPEEIGISLGFTPLPGSRQAVHYETTFQARQYLEVRRERLASTPERASPRGARPWLERSGQEILRSTPSRRIPPEAEMARSPRNLTLRDEGPTASLPEIGEVYRHISGWRFFSVDSSKARRPHFVPEIPEEVPALEPDASNLSAFLYALWRLRNVDFEAVTDWMSRSIELPQSVLVEHDAERGGSGGSEASFYLRRFRDAFLALCEHQKALRAEDPLRTARITRICCQRCLEGWLAADPQAIVDAVRGGNGLDYQPAPQRTDNLSPSQAGGRIAHIIQEAGKRLGRADLRRINSRSVKSRGYLFTVLSPLEGMIRRLVTC